MDISKIIARECIYLTLYIFVGGCLAVGLSIVGLTDEGSRFEPLWFGLSSSTEISSIK